MFENFWGNRAVTESLEQMIGGQRLSQTLLFSGREGGGKATLARRMAARLLGHAELIEKDDLALPGLAAPPVTFTLCWTGVIPHPSPDCRQMQVVFF